MGCDFNPRWFWTSKNIKEVLKILPQCDRPVFHICSGVSSIGDIRLDRSYIHGIEGHTDPAKFQGSANVLGDMTRLPFKNGVAGSVICDPPYKYSFIKPNLISELIRICKPGGKIVFIAPWVPCSAITKVLDTQLWKVGKNRPYHKIMSILVKANGQIEDYL